MKKRFIEDKTLEQFGARLMEITCLTDEEINQIISKPHFFDSIGAEIKKEDARRKKIKTPGKSLIFLNLNSQKIALACGILIIFSVVFSGLIFLTKTESPQNLLVGNTVSPLSNQEFLPIKNPPATEIKTAKIPKPAYQAVKYEKFARENSLKEKRSKSLRKESLPKRRQQTEIVKNQEEFYPLAFAGDLNAVEDTRHIVRAELSSEALIKLGVNLPMENENEVFKTELIVASDGTPLAVKFMKNF